MRWGTLAILVYVVVLLQTTAGRLLTFKAGAAGFVSPDLAAVVVVFLALHAACATDAMLAAWMFGLAVDLTAAGGPGHATVVGPMAMAYALAAGGLVRIREAFFRERALTQALLTLLFCFACHAAWVSAQSLLNYHELTWPNYWRMMLQVVLSSFYSAALTPLGHYLLARRGRWFLRSPPPRRGRR